MKTKLLSIAAIIVFAVTLNACKKGENDPFLSLKTRDSRISGKWDLSDLDYTETETTIVDGIKTTSITKQSYNGSLLTTTADGGTYTYLYGYTLRIEKDGTYISETIVDNQTNENQGDWWWLSDSKKKTRIALDDDYDSYRIDRLTNDELVLSQEYSNQSTDFYGNSSETTTSRTMTFVKIN